MQHYKGVIKQPVCSVCLQLETMVMELSRHEANIVAENEDLVNGKLLTVNICLADFFGYQLNFHTK